ncbi:hypothetical protein [Actinocorallia longicatena]|uniref:Leucine rich repeat (LRR) protein n=1 Tax=Actinocorallia longicatena TaxID=111803 RepID=A0ABP6QBI3_9ACTN
MSDARSVELPGDAELAYTGAWTGGLRGERAFRELDLTGVTDEILGEVGAMPWLKVLNVEGPFTDRGAAALTGLGGLAELGLASDLMTDDAFRGLDRLTGLEVVRLKGAAATGHGFGGLPESVRVLCLRLPRLDLAALAGLRRLPLLGTLVFAGVEPGRDLAHAVAALGGPLTRVEFLGVNPPDPEILRPFAAAGIRVNAAEPV